MKKTLLILTTALAALSLNSCKEDDDVKTVSAVIVVDESGFEDGFVKPETYSVRLVNAANGKTVTRKAKEGTVNVKVIPGVYAVTATAVTESDGVSYNVVAEETGVSIVENGTTVALKAVAAVKDSPLILKEVFIAGRAWGQTDPEDLWSGKTYFRDQFYELYNNGTQTVYADGVAFAQIHYASWDYSTIYQWPIENPGSYVFAENIWQIPGSGTDYPVKPGESIIVAQWATNHSVESLTEGHGIDLSGAEFEAITKEGTAGYPPITITDGPAVNMAHAVTANYAAYMPQWLVSVTDAAFVMFRPSQPLKNEKFYTATNAETDGREIAIADILDAIQYYSDEATWADATKHNIPAILDAGYAFWTNYSGMSASRKVASTREDGTKVYQDTNNSSEDFEIQTTPAIRRDGAKKPSWNTWAK